MLVPKQIAAITEVASTDPARLALQGINIYRQEDGKAVAEVTDGRRLLVAKWTEDDPDEWPTSEGDPQHVDGFTALVDAKAFTKAAKGVKPKKYGSPILENLLLEEQTANGVIKAVAINLTERSASEMRVIEMQFPTKAVYKIVDGVKSADDNVTIGVDPVLMGNMLLAMARMMNSKAPHIKMTVPSDPLKPILLESTEACKRLELTGVLMPCQL